MQFYLFGVVWVSVYIYIYNICISSIYLSVCLPVCLSIYLSIHLSIYLYLYVFLYLYLYLSIYLYLYLSLSLSLSIYLSIRIYIYICKDTWIYLNINYNYVCSVLDQQTITARSPVRPVRFIRPSLGCSALTLKVHSHVRFQRWLGHGMNETRTCNVFMS